MKKTRQNAPRASQQTRKSPQGQTASDNASRSKTSLYEQITEKLLAQMEKGVIPWKRPWKILDNGMAEMPTNYVTKKTYRGINLMLLSCEGYSRPYYMTFRQAQSLGGMVRKGEKGHLVLFYKTLTQEQEGGKDKTLFWERPSYVFNIDQIDGIEFRQPDLQIGQPDETLLVERCEQVYQDYPNPPKIEHKDLSQAFYRKSTDTVNMPPIQAFTTGAGYYSVLFHELSHSTGHPQRLNREELGAGPMGSAQYSREELTAELGAAFLNAICGIGQNQQENLFQGQAAYLSGYMNALRNDVTLFYKASQQAQKAVDHILNRSFEKADQQTQAEPVGEEQETV